MTKQPTGLQQAVRMDEVPSDKWQTMLQRTIIGTLFIGLGIAAAFVLDWGWKVALPCVLFGATIWSTQLVTRSLLALVEPVKAFRRALKGNGA